MMRSKLILVVVTTLVAACETQQDYCIRSNTRELRTVSRLIQETEANLARGYAYETVEITRTEWVICDYVGVAGDPNRPVRPRYCLDDVTSTQRKAVAIDPAAEKRKLTSLKERQAVLARQAEPVIAQCRAKYPEAG